LSNEMVACEYWLRGMYDDGFLVLWPYDTDIRYLGNSIEMVDGDMQLIARVGETTRMGGGAMEFEISINRYDEFILGLPIEECPGPYWVAAELEPLAAQTIPDIYVDLYSSEGQILAVVISQSRPSDGQSMISGELKVDERGCMRVGDYTVFWPPGIYLRGKPLRLVDSSNTTVAEIGDNIQVGGDEKEGPEDYRYFDNKVRCQPPYWGANMDVAKTSESTGSFPGEPTPVSAAQTAVPPTDCIDGEAADMVWPQLFDVLPQEHEPGSELKINGSGGYLRCGDTYIESSRSFPLMLDGKTVSSMICYANRCEGVLAVPMEAHAGRHTISVAGGSSITIDVIVY